MVALSLIEALKMQCYLPEFKEAIQGLFPLHFAFAGLELSENVALLANLSTFESQLNHIKDHEVLSQFLDTTVPHFLYLQDINSYKN